MTRDKPGLGSFVWFVLNALVTAWVVSAGADWWIVALCVLIDLSLLGAAVRGLMDGAR